MEDVGKYDKICGLYRTGSVMIRVEGYGGSS